MDFYLDRNCLLYSDISVHDMNGISLCYNNNDNKNDTIADNISNCKQIIYMYLFLNKLKIEKH